MENTLHQAEEAIPPRCERGRPPVLSPYSWVPGSLSNAALQMFDVFQINLH